MDRSIIPPLIFDPTAPPGQETLPEYIKLYAKPVLPPKPKKPRPGGNKLRRRGKLPIHRTKTDEQIKAEIAAEDEIRRGKPQSPTTTQHPGGRPPNPYDKNVAREICERVANGEHLVDIVKREGMPGRGTIGSWCVTIPEFGNLYARALQAKAHGYIDDIIRIADDSSNDWMQMEHEDNLGWKENGDSIRRAQLRVDTRKWLASKWLGRIYGDRLTVRQETPNWRELKLTPDKALALLEGLNKVIDHQSET